MLKEYNLTLNTKENIAKIIAYVGSDEERMSELIKHFVGKDTRVCQVTSWAVGHIGEQQPNLLAPYHNLLVSNFKDTTKHDAIRRNIARVYQFLAIPESIESELFDLSLANILNNNEAIAIRAFSMTIAERIAKMYPELISELIIAVESTIENGSTGLKNRAVHTIKRLAKRLNKVN